MGEMSFRGTSAVEKEEIELACGVCWPCDDENACVRNWALPCPNQYSQVETESGAIGCVADIDASSKCESEITFGDEDDKRKFAERCGISWACHGPEAVTNQAENGPSSENANPPRPPYL